MSVWHFNWICAYTIEPHLSVCPIRWFKKTSTVLHDAHWANCSYALEQLYPLSLYIQIFLLASFVILIFWYFDILIIVRKWIFGYKLERYCHLLVFGVFGQLWIFANFCQIYKFIHTEARRLYLSSKKRVHELITNGVSITKTRLLGDKTNTACARRPTERKQHDHDRPN